MNDITSRLIAEHERKLQEQWVTGALKELNDTIEEQQSRIAALEAENQRLRNEHDPCWNAIMRFKSITDNPVWTDEQIAKEAYDVCQALYNDHIARRALDSEGDGS